MNRVIKACEKCIWVLGHTFVVAMGTLVVFSISYAFYQLVSQIVK